MARRIDYTDKTKFPVLLQDNEIDQSTSLKLVGGRIMGYGKSINENLLHLLERFAGDEPPRNPTEGVVWFNNSNKVFYRYTNSETWKPVSGITVDSRNPVKNQGEIEGDLWVNSGTEQVYVFIGGKWLPLLNTDKTTRWIALTRRDTIGGLHRTLELIVNNRTITVFSGDIAAWQPADEERLFGTNIQMSAVFPEIKYSLNLINRKTIPEIEVSDDPPLGNQYTRLGDFWINPSSKNIFTYYADQWNRITFKVNVASTSPSSNTPGEDGDLWVDVDLNQMYFYNQLNTTWEPVLINTTFSDTDPPISFTPLAGSYWINTNSYQLYVFTGESWLNLTKTTINTGFFTVIRFDNQIPDNQPHEVLEGRVNGVPVIVISSDSTPWQPSDFEIAYLSVPYNNLYRVINPGVNISGYLSADLVIGDIVATEQQALDGIANDVVMTPLRTKQYLDKALSEIAVVDDPGAIVSPIESGTFLNYQSNTGYIGYSYPQPSEVYQKYLETFLVGNQGGRVKIELIVGWSNSLDDDQNENQMILDYKITRSKEDGSVPVIVASGFISPTMLPGSYTDDNDLRSIGDNKIIHFTDSANTDSATERMKYTLEIRRASGGGQSFIYFAWMTVSHMNFTFSANTFLPQGGFVNEGEGNNDQDGDGRTQGEGDVNDQDPSVQ
jgi:hypothetical protein